MARAAVHRGARWVPVWTIATVSLVFACGGKASPTDGDGPTLLHFTTSGGLPGAAAPDVNVIITDVAKVRAIWSETRALPAVPSGTLACPTDYGIGYHLTFDAFEGATSKVTFDIDPTGCNVVSSNGATTGRVEQPSYWSDLAGVLGVDESEIYPYVPPPNAMATAPSTEPPDCEVPNPYANVDPATVTALHFTTVALYSQTLPDDVDVAVTDIARVQSIFAEMTALPCIQKPAPGEGVSGNGCQYLDFDYQLTFSGSDGATFSFAIKPGNCGYMSVNGAPWAYVAGTYWQDLAATLGVPQSELEGP